MKDNNPNETVYGWWMRSYKKADPRYFLKYFKYFDTDVGNKKITFAQVLDGMKQGKCFYEMCDIEDSEVRKVIFCRLCELYNLKYDAIFELWLGRDCLETSIPFWRKYANYKGKNINTFIKKIEKECGCACIGWDSVDKLKEYHTNLVKNYEFLTK